MRLGTTGRAAWATALLVLVMTLAGCDQGQIPAGAGLEDNGFSICSRPEAGCACEPGRIAACYSDAALEDEETGELYCQEGVRRCEAGGIWGECEIDPGAERLAIIGEPELCGGCDPACFRVHDCPTGRDLNEDNSSNVRFDLDADGIVLGGRIVNARYAYIANSGDGTVSKIDLTTRVVVGQYRMDYSPSRTAIDSRGNAYVAHRNTGGAGGGFVSKIAGDASYCMDRNLNGTIDTSHSRTPLAVGVVDECVIWNRKAVSAAANDGFRAVTIDRRGYIWLGEGDWEGYGDQYFHVLDPETGLPIHAAVPDAFQSYGATVGRDGVLWMTTREADCTTACSSARHLQSINTETYAVGTPVRNPNRGSHYGIAIDLAGRVWVANWGESYLSRYTPSTNSWLQVYVPGHSWVRGVTIDSAGNIWTSADGYAIRMNPETGGDQRVFSLPGCSTAIGIGSDFSDNIWVNCYSSGNAIWLDPDTGATESILTGSGPYTYSDFTGFLRATVTSPEGSYTRLYDSRVVCTGGFEPFWSQLYWEVETPAGTEINFWGRTANEISQLGLSPEMQLAGVPGDEAPADIQRTFAIHGIPNDYRYMEIRVELRSLDGSTSPVFRNMDNVFYCVCNCDVDSTCSAGCTCDSDC